MAVLMVTSLVPTVSATVETELELAYQDYYTFEDATNVTEGSEALEVVNNNTIHAIGVTDGPVTVTVDSVEYDVTVGARMERRQSV